MSKQRIQLSDHFTYSRLLRFVLPCIGTMLFTSIYGIVDGLCVSNFVGKTAFAAVNLIMPLPQLLGTVGFMLGTGGSAIVGITLGEGGPKKADRYDGGESMMQLAQRIYNLLDELKADTGKTYLLVAHNGIARVVHSYFYDMTNEEYAAAGIKNCQLVEYSFG